MLKEMVDLIKWASHMNALASTDDDDNIGPEDISSLEQAIKAMKEAISRHDEQKRKTDEAVCLLFRAASVAAPLAQYEGYQHAVDESNALVRRAERLLGFAQLEPAKA